MRRKVISEFSLGQYKILALDGELPTQRYSKYVIDGKPFNIVPLYDLPNSIAIESNDCFIGKTVEFMHIEAAKTIQQQIDEMYSGNTEAIVTGVHSKNDYILMNAILSGAKLKIKEEDFVAGVDKARTNEIILLGFPIKSVAEAAYHFLTDRKYNGSDPVVATLIKNKFII